MKRYTLAVSLLVLMSQSAFAEKTDKFGGIKDMAKQQAGGYAAEKLNLPSAAAPGTKVYIISPKEGETLSSPVKVVFGLSGMGVAPAGMQSPNTGHHHLLIDAPTVDFTVPMPVSDQIKHFGGGQTETSVALKPGTHKLQLVFADWKHQSFNPTAASETINITVK